MDERQSWSRLLTRGVVGGVLMGLANLVPGISGGTMLLAVGIYPAFVTAVAEVTTLRFRPRSVVLLGTVAGAAGLAILLLAGLLRDLVTDHRWVMYSLFIGLTLGGVPVLVRLIGKVDRAAGLGALVGFVAMSGLALLQGMGAVDGAGGGGALWMGIAGLAAASAMILPGVSGSYLLLVLGMYVPILEGVDALKEALSALDPAAILPPLLSVVLPVGIGVLLGIAAVSNVLRWLLQRYENATLGALLGLLLGAVFGLYPFQEAVPPQVGDTIKGQVVTEESLPEIDPEDWPAIFVTPTPGQLAGSLGLLLVGFGITSGLARLGREPEGDDTADAAAGR